ncbi:MAG: hypothetical protein V4501_01330, partial [Pseudomonadota bacterium]
MPTPLQNLTAALGQQPGTLITEEWPADFYAPNGFQPAPNRETVVQQWLTYDYQIYFNDIVLSKIINEARAKHLYHLITNFIAVVDENTKTTRTKAWNWFVKKVLPESVASDLEKCAAILATLAETNYAATFTLDKYHAEQNVANIEVNSALVVMNISIKEAFNFLTIRNIDSAIEVLPAIIYKHLLSSVPEGQKNALIEALLTYVYRGGVINALYNAHQQNLIQSDYRINSKKDWEKTTIQFRCSGNKVACIEQTPISTLLTDNPQLIPLAAEYADDGESKDEQEEVDTLNLIASEHCVSFRALSDIQVKISVDYAKSYSFQRQAIELVKLKWQQKINALIAYGRQYLVKQRHDLALQNNIFAKYPEITKEPVESNETCCFTFFNGEPLDEKRGRQLFKYLGRNSLVFIEEQAKLLNSYARKGEDQFTYAIKLLRELDAYKVVGKALSSYINSNLRYVDHASGNDGFIRNAYRFMRGHGVYLTFKLLADMKFHNATVLTQHPPRLLQYDRQGKLLLEKELDLTTDLPLCAKNYLKVFRYVDIVEFIKPRLTSAEYDELNYMLVNNAGIALDSYQEFFDYPKDYTLDDENIIPVSPRMIS